MSPKPALIAAGVVLAIIGISAADVPDLVGTWTGTFEGYQNGMGYVARNETGIMILTISEQTGRLFTGNLSLNVSSIPEDLGTRAEGFSGIIALDNKTLYIAEYDKGYDIGTIISNDTIELNYLEDGENGCALIDTFQRVR
ncbi:MAG: hypothetical protein A4E45_00459 [Methanosaeta sp. PtaB.Bin039]|nr:MAG: hypothetical protein A4E45_00459 [Methanosaeta sp. PtaB.Bin039]OPY44931.1 MAG: hypothetical protein A4E47_01257 [Methanosaeta sp. PtaU1.Bin028]HOT07223.1 hypothetical protein [Methanotrichaceae archaeon]HQF17172.1 hypothetical protein [Methanotrichaceae archaeon]HQI91745.1 hypothetical protein [Methanotrichaceae archaeon]